MSLTISSTDDIYKFSVVLFDYLKANGNDPMAEALFNVVDECFATSEDALSAHKKVFLEIRNNNPDLPPDYEVALNKAISLISEIQ